MLSHWSDVYGDNSNRNRDNDNDGNRRRRLCVWDLYDNKHEYEYSHDDHEFSGNSNDHRDSVLRQ